MSVAVPSTVTVSTTEATTNPATDTAASPCMGSHSVWYRFTPTTSVTARAITRGSTYDTLLGVFTGTPNALTPVACSDDAPPVSSGVEVAFVAGKTYFLAISSCCDLSSTGSGTAILQLYRPRPFTLTAKVNRTAAGDVSGRALLTGTVACSNPGGVEVSLTLSQRLGARVARGSGAVVDACDRRARTWTVRVDSETGLAFRPGRAVLTLGEFASDGFSTVDRSSDRIVTLVLAPNE